ncbi:polysaccharide biosynthesis tyrosine autokinase [Fulvivirga sp.]|uniref:GumC family protein n=1 Tax=Fulvivirga sp. TaxID=1931237 RepID=UPI0032F0845E
MTSKDSGYPFERDMMQFEASRESGSNLIDYKRILYRALRYWYVIISTLVVSLVVAYSINRYSTRIYPIKASIIIKENQENVGAKLLYNNALVNPYRNFYNELYILKSVPLMSSVVENLDLNTRYFREGEIKTTEVYDKNIPFKFHFLEGHTPSGKTMELTLLNANRFKLQLLEDTRTSEPITYEFGDTIRLYDYHFLVISTGGNQNYVDRRLLINFNSVEATANGYISRLKAYWQEQGASVVNMEINTAVPEKEIDFLNELIKQYQQYDLDKKNETATQSIEFIDSQLQLIKDSLQYFEREVETFKQKNVITNLEGEALRLYQRVEGLEANLAQLRLQKNYYQYLTEYLRKEDNLNQVVPPTSVGVEDPIMTSLITSLVQLQTELNLQTSRGKEETSLIERKRAQVAKIRADIQESVESSLEAQKINEQFIKQQIKLVDQQLAKLPESERRLVNLQRNYTLSENLYIFLMQKRAEAGISKASTTSDIVVVNPARQMGGAIAPKPSRNYAIAGAMGVMLPFVFFLIMELLNNKVQSKEDIENVTNIPLIGGVGHNGLSDNLIVYKKPKSGVAESFRSLRSNLNFFTEGKDKKIFLITSSISGEGKTFSTINLATVLAFSNKRTLIVGADMRKPRLFGDFNLNNDVGLSNYLSGQMAFTEIIQDTNIDNLVLISGGPVPPNPSELLMSDRMEKFMAEAIKNFDFVIMDTPPIGLVTDAFILSKYADHTLFLVRQDYTPKQAIKTVQEFYENGKIKKVSLLFNDIKRVGPGYGYGEGYGYGYGYGYGNKKGNGGYYQEG